MYSNHDRPHLSPITTLITGISNINSRLGNAIPFVGAAGIQPLDVQVVARAIITATLSPESRGPIEVSALAKLGTLQ